MAKAGKRRNPVDQRGRLAELPFEHRVTKDGVIRICYGGRVVATVAGDAARRLARSVEAAADDREAQLLLAKATGNFKRGNERH